MLLIGLAVGVIVGIIIGVLIGTMFNFWSGYTNQLRSRVQMQQDTIQDLRDMVAKRDKIIDECKHKLGELVRHRPSQ